MSRLSPWRTFLLVMGPVIVGTFNFSIVFVGFPEIAASFDTDEATVSWTLTAYSITQAALLVPGGWLADRLGRKRLFLLGMTVFAVGSLAVAVAPTIELLIAARILQATGVAFEGPASLAILLDAFPATRRSTAVGAWGGVGGGAAALGPVIGGALIETVGWRWTFALNVPVIALTVLLASRLLPAGPRGADKDPPDMLGIACLVAGVTSLALAIVESDSWGWIDARTGIALVLAAVLLSVLVARSSTHPGPVLALALYRDRNFSIGSVLAFTVAGNFGGTYLAFVVLLTEGWGLSLYRAGLALAFIPLVGGSVSVLAGRLADRYGAGPVIAPGSAIMAAAGLWLALSLSNERDIFGLWLPIVGLYAVGVGTSHAATTAAAMTNVDDERLGVASAMVRIAQEIGNTVAVAVAIALLAAAEGDAAAGARRVMVPVVVTGVIGALAAPLLRRIEPIPTAGYARPHVDAE